MNKAYAIIGAAFLSLASSCSTDELYQQEPSNIQTDSEYVGDVTISASDFEYEASSRTSFNINGNKAEFRWTENDTVGIFPDKGNQVEFPMANGAGTNTASFDGGGWGLKNASTYYAYYPFQGKNYHIADAKTKIPVSYTGQTQTSNGNLNHLGAYDFMAAQGTKPTNGGLNFQFNHLGALVKLTINVVMPTTLTSITLETTDDDFTIDGYVDITADTPSITAKTRSNTMTLPLTGVTTTYANEAVVIYFMMAPTDLSAKSLSLAVVDVENTTMVVDLTPKNFQAGHAYTLNAEINLKKYINGHEYVDLGLPSGLKWATCNIGADKPSDYGDYFAWGETATKSSFGAISATSNEKAYSELQKGGIIDSNNILTPQYDAASVIWQGSWRMPTLDEINELVDHCTWTWKWNQEGYIVTGNNGNSIFLPAAGYYSSTGLEYAGSSGDYLSAEAKSGLSYYCLSFTYSDHKSSTDFRGYGLPIRPVSE